jgi:hypothetical protein
METDVLIVIMGGLFIVIGILVRFGLWKSWYWRSRGGAYAYVTMGMVFILYAGISRISEQGGIIYYLYIALFLLMIGLTVYFSLRPPAWMKPTWVTWIEKHPKSVVKAMKEAAQDSDFDWKERVVDEKSVDLWAKKFRSK